MQQLLEQERERRQGLDRRLQEERRQWEQERQELTQQVQEIVQTLSRLTGQQEAPAAQAPQAPTPQTSRRGETQEDALAVALERARAEQFRGILIDQMTAPGGPYEDLRGHLQLFAENIPLHRPDLGSDGRVNDSAQRAAIETMANALRGVRGDAQTRAQETVLQGMMPGSAPGAPAGPTAADMLQEFHDIMDVMGSREWDTLERGEQQRLEARYFELAEDQGVRDGHGGSLRPSMDWSEMQQTLRDMVQRMNRIEGRGQSPFGNMA